MQEPRHARTAAVGLLVLLVLSSSQAMALTLPSPPDQGSPSNTQAGPVQGASSFSGGISLVKDSSSFENRSASEFIVEFYCIAHGPFVSKHFDTQVGESVGAPLSNDQASGLVAAVNSVRPPESVPISVSVGAFDQEGNITYHMTGMTYNVTTYSVWAHSQQSGVEQRVGYVVVSVPVKAIVVRGSTDLTGSSCEVFALSTYGEGWRGSSVALLQERIGPLGSLPEQGLYPLFTYGPVRLLSGSTVVGSALVKPHSNVTFALTPGTYSAVSTVSILGIPFSVNCGTYTTDAASPQFTVTLTEVGKVWYEFETVATLLTVAAILLISWRLGVFRVMARGYRRASKAVNEWIAERMRAYAGAAGGLPSWTPYKGTGRLHTPIIWRRPRPAARQTL